MLHDKFKIGDIVRVIDPSKLDNGTIREVVSIHPDHPNPIPYGCRIIRGTVTPLTWTAELPTEAGYYFARTGGSPDYAETDVYYLAVSKRNNPNVFVTHEGDELPVESFAEFAGPIPMPLESFDEGCIR